MNTTAILRLGRLAGWCLAMAPAMLMAYFIMHCGVDIIRRDEWEVLRFIRIWHGGDGFTLSDLFSQANDSRPAIPRLVIIVLAGLTGGNNKAEMIFTLLVVLANLWMLVALFRGDGADSGRFVSPGVLGVVALILFSPWQIELLWGFQMLVHLPMTWLLLGMLVVRSSLSADRVVLILILLCIASTYSYANGMLVWPLLAAFAVAHRGSSVVDSWPRWVLYALCGATILAAYSAGFARTTTTSLVIWHRDFVPAFLRFLGAPLAGFPRDGTTRFLAMTAGTMLMGILLVCMIGFLRRQPVRTIQRIVPLLVVCAYVLLSALLTTAGRISMDSSNLATRYGAFSTYFIAAVFLIALIAWRSVARTNLLRWPGLVLLVALFAAEGFSYATSIPVMRRQSVDLWRHRAALMFADDMLLPETADTLFFGNASRLRSYVREARSYGLLKPRLAADAFHAAGQSTQIAGALERLAIDNGILRAAGWAYLSSPRRPVACVVLTAEDGGRSRVIAIVFPTRQRADVRATLGIRDVHTGWFVETSMRGDPATLRAWAVNGDSGEVHRLVELHHTAPRDPLDSPPGGKGAAS